jgi:hypothetical protein
LASYARWARVGTYPVARLAAVLVTAGVFFVLAGGISYLVATVMVTGTLLTPLHTQLLASVTLLGVAFFGGQAAALSLLDAYSQGRFPLPDGGLPPPSAARAENPWRSALRGTLGIGLISAGLAYFALPRLWPQGLRPGDFAMILGAAGACLSAAQVYARSGEDFLREATLPAPARTFHGTHTQYLWLRHALPQGLANLFLNAWAAAALVPGPFFASDAAAPLQLVLSDAFGNLLVLLVATAGGTSVHASFDVRWGVIPALPVRRPMGWQRALILTAGLGLPIGSVYAWFALSGAVAMSAWTFVCVRALCCGLVCAGVAYVVGYWTLCAPADASE